jgi:transcriptional regulator with XRE-family HTH domain
MAQKPSRNKGKTPGIRIRPKDGLWIVYQLRLAGIRQADFAARLGVSTATVSKVLAGRTKSARIETALCKVLGYESFEAMLDAAKGKGRTA